ncbi:MAG: CG0192-related protein [Nocardioides sp.]
MSLVHRATLTPTKQELVEAWLPAQWWAAGRRIDDKLAEYRFEDPAGEVGVETILWSCDDGSVIQTPLTYRAAPLAGAEDHLVGTSEHSVLGARYVYDGCTDPVWAQTLATAIATGGTQSQMYFEEDGRRTDVPPRMQVVGTGGVEVREITSVDSTSTDGDVTVVRAGGVELALARTVGTPLDGTAALTGQWGDGRPVVVAVLR